MSQVELIQSAVSSLPGHLEVLLNSPKLASERKRREHACSGFAPQYTANGQLTFTNICLMLCGDLRHVISDTAPFQQNPATENPSHSHPATITIHYPNLQHLFTHATSTQHKSNHTPLPPPCPLRRKPPEAAPQPQAKLLYVTLHSSHAATH